MAGSNRGLRPRLGRFLPREFGLTLGSARINLEGWPMPGQLTAKDRLAGERVDKHGCKRRALQMCVRNSDKEPPCWYRPPTLCANTA
jgi:hypothetical protein